MPLEVEESGKPLDLLAFEQRVIAVHNKVKAQHSLCEVSNKALRSMGLSAKVGQKTKVTVQAVMPVELVVAIPNIEQYGGKTPEEQNTLMAEWLAANIKQIIPGMTINEGARVLDITQGGTEWTGREISQFVCPEGTGLRFVSSTGRVAHIVPNDGGTRNHARCGSYMYTRYEGSSRSTGLVCAKCCARL
jgi:hypothetical protein